MNEQSKDLLSVDFLKIYTETDHDHEDFNLFSSTDWVIPIKKVLDDSSKESEKNELAHLLMTMSHILFTFSDLKQTEITMKMADSKSFKALEQVFSDFRDMTKEDFQLNQKSEIPEFTADSNKLKEAKVQEISQNIRNYLTQIMKESQETQDSSNNLLFNFLLTWHIQINFLELSNQSVEKGAFPATPKNDEIINDITFLRLLNQVKSVDSVFLQFLKQSEALFTAFTDILVLCVRLVRTRKFSNCLNKLSMEASQKVQAQVKKLSESFKIKDLAHMTIDLDTNKFKNKYAESINTLFLHQVIFKEIAHQKNKQLEKSKTKVSKLQSLNLFLKEQLSLKDSPELYIELQNSRKLITDLQEQLQSTKKLNISLENKNQALSQRNQALASKLEQDQSQDPTLANLEQENQKLKQKISQMQRKTREVELMNIMLDSEKRFNIKELVELREKVLEIEQNNVQKDSLEEQTEEVFHNIWDSEDGRTSTELINQKVSSGLPTSPSRISKKSSKTSKVRTRTTTCLTSSSARDPSTT